MNRRSFFKALLALPLAPLAAKLLPKMPEPTLLGWARSRPDPVLPVVEALSNRYVGLDMAIGSDQTSIWLVKCGKPPGQEVIEDSKFLQAMADDLESQVFYMGRPLVGQPLVYPQLSTQEKIRRTVRNSVRRT